jgi:prepilin-type N-terminal cleavage/methylation domain-containing protein
MGAGFMSFNRRGFTLLELLVVLMIIAAMAGLVIPLVSASQDESFQQTTLVSLGRLREAINGTPERPGYYSDMRRLPATIADLFSTPSYLPAEEQSFDRNTRHGWHGPYIQNQSGTYSVDDAYGDPGDPAVLDGWGTPIVIQVMSSIEYARLVSAGPNRVIDTPLSDNEAVARGDDLIVFLKRADVLP